MSKYPYSKQSADNLATADPRLQMLFNKVSEVIDCTIIYGHRNIKKQQELYQIGRTTEMHRHPVTSCDGIEKKSNHNFEPSKAIDAAPCPIRWNDRERFVHFAGIVKGIASLLDIKIRWGGDWDNDNDLRDQSWMDLPHFELVD